MHQASYGLFQDGGHYGDFDDLNVAISLAEEFLGSQDGTPTTFSVHNQAGALLASVTNRRIEGVFHKQAWNDNDYAVDLGEVSFDATNSVLLLELAHLVDLTDNDDASDDIGTEHVDHDGPYWVEIEESVRAYFGVDELGQITQEALDYARRRENVQEPVHTKAQVRIELSLCMQPGLDLAQVLKVLRLSVRSQTPGALIEGFEVHPI